ncbi:hypothetical protein [Streptomyces glaucus]|uniref:Secreted protein n=1 Tax=Streptomyces glaucus TaxID=284029 RepID=A0ABN3JPG5_9ACTN
MRAPSRAGLAERRSSSTGAVLSVRLGVALAQSSLLLLLSAATLEPAPGLSALQRTDFDAQILTAVTGTPSVGVPWQPAAADRVRRPRAVLADQRCRRLDRHRPTARDVAGGTRVKPPPGRAALPPPPARQPEPRVRDNRRPGSPAPPGAAERHR